MLLDVAANGVLEIGDGGEHAAPDTPAGDDGEEVFDGVDLGGGGWREMEDPARMIGQPLLNFGMFVGGIVVGDGMDELAGWDGALDGVEERDEFLVGVPGHAAPDDGAIEDVEGGEQGGGAVAFVIVCPGAATAGLQRQTGLGTIERLDLAFLVDRHDDGVLGWVHVEADDVLDLGGERRVVGLLEGPDAMRLEAMSRPDPLNGAQTDADDFGHHAARPVGCGFGRLTAGQSQHLGDDRRRQRRAAGKRVLSRSSPAMPSSAKRCCQRHTEGRLAPLRAATSSTVSRSADRRMILTR